ncbi:ribosome biogenesis protein MAK21 [Diplogelasinospora grovesii]|uniref:Ribosome biogenesis protein MAK21 n=1 Tax=Diplogelasinospora grovesii TaxID=303347 RepID=A0AAN6NKG3_9PEZI|nr:ribosome biogenesis protein MAK21 [Diplogelasinospora grovesii]
MGASNRAKPKKRASLPDFDENALAQLTSKIDKSLPNPEAFPAKRKRPNGAEDGPDSKRRQTQPAGPKPKQKEREKSGKKTRSAAPSSLLEEILALGGDEADLELVANVDSGNEDGDTPKPKTPLDAPIDQAFQDELANFASTLGFQKIQQDEDLDTEEEAEDIEETRAGESEDEDEHEPEEPETTTAGAQKETRSKNAGKLMFEPRSDWYAVNTERLPSSVPDDIKQYSSSIANLKSYADSLLEEDSATYGAMQASTSTQRFMSTIMSSGTLSDKVSALTLSIQESPLHSRKAFENLIALAGKKSRGQAIAALGALVDLLGNGMVLPSERRLRPFSAQPALLGSLAEQPRASWTKGQKLPGHVTKSHLMMWAYEDWLKGAYFRIIQLLEVWCADEIEYSRSRALDFVYGLLKDKPEQEANLLRLLVNKLGDRDRKIASRASYLLLQLLNLHPGMKAVVISAVEHEVLLKPTQSLRTRYYAINTLNQTILSSKEPAIADTLLRIYFDIFLALLKSGSLGDFEAADTDKKSQAGRKKNRKRKGHGGDVSGNDQETSQKLVSAVLTGVNRAIPFTTTDESTLEKHLDTLFRITHSSNFNTSVQALMLIQQLAASKHLAVDRFYRTLYESLLDPRLVTSSKQALYLNLLYRSLKNDVDVRRVKAFVKRMVQILSLHQPSFACGLLFLIAELEGPFPDLHALLTVPEDQGDDGEEVYRDVTEEESPKDAAPQEAVATGGRHSLAYDGRKRDPEHSNAHQSCLWELIPFLSHFHPSVCVFASNLLARQNSLPKPELANHTLMHFLDKFVYRNPKAAESKRGGSIMQPVLASGSASHVVVSSKASAKQQPVVNSASFWNLKPEQVSAEDVFFHEYFARIGKPGEAARSKNTGKDDAVVAGSDGEEDEIWEALVNSRPEVQGEGDGDSDLDMEGYEDSDDEDLALADGAKGASIGEDVSDPVSEGSGDDMAFEGIFDDSEAEGDRDGDDDGSDDGHGEVASGKERQRGRLNRKEMRSLPTFASADDYAEMLGAEEDGLDDQ